jgi:ferredoxin
MIAKVDPELCIGCELCVGTAPDIFEMDGSVSVASSSVVDAALEEDVQTAIDECPVDAISAD